MNFLDKWIFNSIDLQEPQKKHLKYFGTVGLLAPKGYCLLHFRNKDGSYTEDLVKINNDGYGFTKFGQKVFIDGFRYYFSDKS